MPVKEETAGANDDTLLFSDDMMTELQRQAHNFQLDAFTNIDNAQMLLSGESMVRHPLMTLNQVNFENFKPEDILNNFVKYKLIDGKHVKFYQCTICKYQIVKSSSALRFSLCRFEGILPSVHLGAPPADPHRRAQVSVQRLWKRCPSHATLVCLTFADVVSFQADVYTISASCDPFHRTTVHLRNVP